QRATGHALDRLYDLFHGESVTSAEVDRAERLVQPLDCLDMGIDEIDDMDVVPDRGAILCRVVRSENREPFALAQQHLERHRDDMGLRPVVFAAFFCRARDIEIPERRVVQLVLLGVHRQELLDDPLGVAVGVDRLLRVVFPDREGFRLAVDRGRGAEDEARDTNVLDGVEEIDATADIRPVVLAGGGNGFGHEMERGEVQHRFGVASLDGAKGLVGLSEVARDGLGIRMYSRFVTAIEAIEGDDVIPLFDEPFDGDTADVAATAGNQNPHPVLLVSRERRQKMRHSPGRIVFSSWYTHRSLAEISCARSPDGMTNLDVLAQADPAVARAVQQEQRRQLDGIELIASENYVSEAVLAAGGTVLTNKYAEGLPGKRYYGGCEYVDVVER